MAATVSAWAKPGAWALDSEEREAELEQLQREDAINGNGKATGDYPTLAAAAAAPKTKKKSKAQTLSLQEFSAYGTAPKQSTFQASKGLTPDELLALPTGPRQRSAEELERTKGFRSYGTRDDQPRRQRESTRDFAPPPPSRADETDDWGAAKKFTTGSNGFERRERREGGGFFSDSQSRADEVDNWASTKTFVPSDGARRNERRGFDSNGGSGRADSDNWAKRKEEEGRKFGSFGGAFDSLRERRGGSSDSLNGVESDTWGKKREESNGGRPRLNLQPRTLPVGGGDGQQQNNNVESLVKPKGSSPFGNARPREEVLKEKGQDWKEIEEKLEAGKIKETGEERRKKGFGSGGWRGNLQEDRIEQAWRKPADTVDTPPSSAETGEDVPAEEAEDKEPQI